MPAPPPPSIDRAARPDDVRDWLAAFIIREVDPARVLAVTAEAIGRLLGASRVEFGEINVTAERCYFLYDWTDGVPSIQGPQPFYTESEFGRLYASGRTAVVDDYSKLQLVRNEGELLDEAGGRYFIAVPLLRDGEVVAVFAASDHRPRRWREDEVALMTEVGPMIWRAYEHLLALERLGEAERMLASMAGPAGADTGAETVICAFCVATPNGPIRVPVDQVEWIRSLARLCGAAQRRRQPHLAADDGRAERGLDKAVMLRVHRSAFVAVAAVRAVERLGRRMVLTLQSGTSIAVSAGYVDAVRARLGAVLPGRRVAPRSQRPRPAAVPNPLRGRSVPRADGRERSQR